MSDLLRVDCRLAVTDSPIADLPYKIKCREPGHQDDCESMAIYVDGLKCFGCGLSISRRLDTLAYLLYGRYDDATTKQLIRNKDVLKHYTAESLDGYRRRVAEEAPRDPLPSSYARVYSRLLSTTRKDRKQWYYDRGLSSFILRKFVLGHAGTAFTIPIYSADHKLLTFRYRQDFDITGKYNPDGKPYSKYYGYAGRNGLYLYPLHSVELLRPSYLYVVEGELDALRLWQEGIPAVSVTNGGGNMQKIPQMIKEHCSSVRSLVIMGDMDERGRIASTQCYAASQALGFDTKMIEWDLEHGKDVTEYLGSGRTLWQTNTSQKQHILSLI